MQHRHTASSPARDQLVEFLDSHLGIAYSDDVGPLFGEVAMMRDSVVFSAALAAETGTRTRQQHAPRRGTKAAAARRR